MIHNFTVIVLILIFIASYQVNANPCTLCSGGNPNEFPDIIAAGGKTCLELAIDAAFYDEDDRFCGFFRQVASEPCECGKEIPSPTTSPTISKTPTTQRCTLCPNNKPIPDDYKDKRVTKHSAQTCMDVERTSMKYLESSNACANLFRPVGESHCGCAIPNPTLHPSSESGFVFSGLESVDESISDTSGTATSISTILIGCGVGLAMLLLIGAFFVKRRFNRKEDLPSRIQEAKSNENVDDQKNYDELSCRTPFDEGIEMEIVPK